MLYITLIEPCFDEMIEKMVYTFKFSNLPNIGSLKEDCKAWLITVLNKFDPTRGFKAFSYFSVITKNWFIHQTKVIANINKREVALDLYMYSQEVNSSTNVDEGMLSDNFVINNHFHENQEKKDFYAFLSEEMGIWYGVEDMKEIEKRVLVAIKGLLENPDTLEIFSKRAIFIYLREITRLNTKQITQSINKIKDKYQITKKDWNNEIF